MCFLPSGKRRFEAEFEAGMSIVAQIMDKREDTSAKYLTGDEPIFADVYLASQFFWLRAIGEKNWNRIKVMQEGRWDSWVKQFEPFMKNT